MAAPASPSAKHHEHIVELTRVFDAPRERVFAAWTRAEHLAHWFGPKGFARLEEIIRVTCAQSGAKTMLTLHATAAGSSAVAAAMLKGMDQGWAETIDRLALRIAR